MTNGRQIEPPGERLKRKLTMPKNKGIYRIFRTKAEYDAFCEDLRHFSRVFMLDHVTIALGRMGWREKKFRDLIMCWRRLCAST